MSTASAKTWKRRFDGQRLVEKSWALKQVRAHPPRSRVWISPYNVKQSIYDQSSFHILTSHSREKSNRCLSVLCKCTCCVSCHNPPSAYILLVRKQAMATKENKKEIKLVADSHASFLIPDQRSFSSFLFSRNICVLCACAACLCLPSLSDLLSLSVPLFILPLHPCWTWCWMWHRAVRRGVQASPSCPMCHFSFSQSVRAPIHQPHGRPISQSRQTVELWMLR